jgi:AraC-like DNA-binding protein
MPLQLIQERKMLEARRMLRHTELPAKEIAYELGYEELLPLTNTNWSKMTVQK